MYCPNCKRDVGADALYCPECGTKTEMVSARRCSGCGAELGPDMSFCPVCGLPAGQAPLVQERRYHQGGLNQGGYAQDRQSGYTQNGQDGYQQGEYQLGGPGNGSGSYRQEYQQYNQGGGRQPVQTTPPGRNQIPVVAIVAACACVLIVAVTAIFFLAKMGQGDSVQGENQTARELRSEETGEEKQSSKSSEENLSKEEENQEEKTGDQAEQVIDTGNEAQEASADKKDAGNTVPTQAITPEPIKTFAGAKDKISQQAVVTAGGQLDLRHMGNLMANTGSTYGIYVLDITNMQEYDGGSAEVSMPASALIGVPILFTIADGVDKGDINLDSQVTLQYTFENGRGIFKKSDSGRTFPVSQMLSEALMNSDNNALNSLMDFLSLSRINDTCHSYGFSSVDIQRKLMTGSTSLENYISAKDAAMMLNAIYQDNFVGIGRAFLEANFRISGADTANRGMYPACTTCGTFLNLNGITESRYNEIGLIQNGDEIFILSVFTCNGVGTTSASALTSLTSYVVGTLRAQ